jgi:predicted nuclease of predicted toxin-antitoxin system
LKLIVDAQLPPALAAALRQAGCDAVAVREIGLREAKDTGIWQYALQNNAAIMTNDEDFAERCLRSQNPPVVVWLRIGNATNPVLLGWFLPLLPALMARIEAGDRLIEVR